VWFDKFLFLDAKMNRREAALILGVRYDYKPSFVY
jgi:hypothetical protein